MHILPKGEEHLQQGDPEEPGTTLRHSRLMYQAQGRRYQAAHSCRLLNTFLPPVAFEGFLREAKPALTLAPGTAHSCWPQTNLPAGDVK